MREFLLFFFSDQFPKYAESIPAGETSQALSNAAKKNEIFVIGGTFPEKDDNKLYNTCTVWNPQGELIAKFRKVRDNYFQEIMVLICTFGQSR